MPSIYSNLTKLSDCAPFDPMVAPFFGQPMTLPEDPYFSTNPGENVKTVDHQGVVSRAILLQYLRKAYPDVWYMLPAVLEYSSANGDLLSDIVFAHRDAQRSETPTFLVACLDIYGVTDIYGAKCIPPPRVSPLPPLAEPIFDARTNGFHASKEQWTRRPEHLAKTQYNIRQRFTLNDDDDMVAILNARGTVILNTLFQQTPEQVKILRLSELALHIFGPFADDYFTPQVESLAKQRYWRMIPVIREDIQIHLLNVFGRLPSEMQLLHQKSIAATKDKIGSWRNHQRLAMRFEKRDGHLGCKLAFPIRRELQAEMMGHKRFGDCFVQGMEFPKLAHVQSYREHPPVHPRTLVMGPYSFNGEHTKDSTRDEPLNFPELIREKDNCWFKA